MIRKALKIAAFGVVGLTVASGGWIAYGSRDLPEVDDADLRVERPPLDPEENLLTHLNRLVERMGWGDEDTKRAVALLRADVFDRTAAATLLAQREGALNDVPRLLEMPSFQLPAREHQDDLPELQSSSLALALALRSRLAAENGDAKRAVRDAFLVLDLGQRLEQARGAGLISVMEAMGIKRRGLDALDRTPQIAGFEPERVKGLTKRLGSYRTTRQAWADMWAVEYEWLGLVFAEHFTNGSGDHWHWVPDRYVFHPNRSKQLWVDFFQSLQHHAWAPTCTTMEFPAGLDLQDPVRLRGVLGPNLVGRMHMWIAAPNFVRFPLKRCLLDAEVSATQARLALRAWRRDHGTLPGALRDLVPRYLDAVPVDAFDGRPLRYSPDAGRVWSVGSDLRDGGGQLSEGEDPLQEIAFPI